MEYDYILACAAVQEGQILERYLSRDHNGTVRIWDLRTGETQIYFQGHLNAGEWTGPRTNLRC